MEINYSKIESSQRHSKDPELSQLKEKNKNHLNYSSLESGQVNLNEKLLNDPETKAQSNTSEKGISIKICIVFSIISFIIEMIWLEQIYSDTSLFSYCFWNFGYQKYFEGENSPFEQRTNGNLFQFITRNCCKIDNNSICPGVCNLVQNLISNEILFYNAALARFAVLVITYSLMLFEIRRNHLLKAKRIFGVMQFLTLSCLIVFTIASLVLTFDESFDSSVQENDQVTLQGLHLKSGIISLFSAEICAVFINSGIYSCMRTN